MSTLPAPYYERDGITIYHGDNREILPHIEPVHAVVTDPPYGLSFMGKGWDHSVPGVEFWQAIMAAMLPGAHLLSFGGTRTYHRMAVAIEDAGYEIRDTLQWLYGSGFPKSHDVSKAIDKMAGAEREVVGYKETSSYPDSDGVAHYRNRSQSTGSQVATVGMPVITAPATPAAEQWQGWGTALKPAYEPIIMARLPFKGTVAQNVLAHGTGAINVDACRIGTNGGARADGNGIGQHVKSEPAAISKYPSSPQVEGLGRWPSNVILDEAAAQDLGEPARYFYCAKSSRRERNAGLEGMPERAAFDNASGAMGGNMGSLSGPRANHHPTVKPIALMRYLIQMVTPPGGIVLDPFMGSGSTLVAAAELGFDAIGIELSEEYAEIAARRVDHALNERARQLPGLEALA